MCLETDIILLQKLAAFAARRALGVLVKCNHQISSRFSVTFDVTYNIPLYVLVMKIQKLNPDILYTRRKMVEYVRYNKKRSYPIWQWNQSQNMRILKQRHRAMIRSSSNSSPAGARTVQR